MDTLEEIIAFLERVGSHFNALPSDTGKKQETTDPFSLKKSLVHKIMLNLRKKVREVEATIKDPEQNLKRISSLQMLRTELEVFNRERAELRDLFEREKIELQKHVDEDGLDPRDAEDINTERKRICDLTDEHYDQIHDAYYALSDTRQVGRFGGRQRSMFSRPTEMTRTRLELQTKDSSFSSGRVSGPIPEVDVSIADTELGDIDGDYEAQMAVIRKQEDMIDDRLDVMHEVLLSVKKQTYVIRDEMELQDVMIDDTAERMDETAATLDNETKRMKKIVKKLRSGSKVIVDIILIVVLLGVIGTAYWLIKQRTG
eukprot:gnl/Carplike_NY0171/1068_a1459_1522.p1 GENE.gnl/Carplike_NY0171/1068_a1459_1522~~gnl/Carplike_NY0171/1068_a1459_1522.p1  ORF type:complete len:315 (+),score=63.52 gnl/Carplike_NY0171/1068_a1459_1522:23-967(+)